MSTLKGKDHVPGDLDHPEDWRKVEYTLMVTGARDKLEARQWPSWLRAQGDWFNVQLTIEGRPVGPPLAWPNALFIAAWLMKQ